MSKLMRSPGFYFDENMERLILIYPDRSYEFYGINLPPSGWTGGMKKKFEWSVFFDWHLTTLESYK